MKFIELDRSLKERVESVYVISGEDAYCRSAAAEKIIKAVNPICPEFNIVNAEGYIDEVISACEVVPFLSPRRIVKVVEFYPIKEGKDRFAEYVKQSPKETCLIIVNEKGSEIEKLQGVTVVDCSKMDRDTLIKWISVTCKRAGKEITVNNAGLVVDYCLADMTRIHLETEKLICYCDKEIKKEDIEGVVFKESDFKVFELTEKIALHDTKGAVLVLEELLSRGEEPTALLAMIYAFFRRMFYTVNNSLEDKDLAKALGVKPAAITFTKRKATQFGASKLRKLLQMCAIADMDIKTSASDKTDRLKLLVIQATIKG